MGVQAWTVAAAAAAVLASWAFNALVHLVWRPYTITRSLRSQGIAGPGYTFFIGNLAEIKRLRAEAAAATALDVGDHDLVPLVQPHHRKWIELYGRTFVYWIGATPSLCVADVNVVRQVLSDRSGLYPKNIVNHHISRLLGKGLILTDGEEYMRHRKVVHPAFNIDKLKMMTVTMSDCVRSMLSDWEAKGAAGDDVEIELSRQFEELTADVISHTAFGSSYKEGRQVFLAQRELQFLAFSTAFNVQIPGFRYLPTEKNLRTWNVDKQVRTMLMDIIKTRLANKDTAGYGNDLLGLMLEACTPEHGEAPILTMDEIIDECKTFFFAGHDTTSHLLTWASFLLSTHPEWQDKLREEVRRECGNGEEEELTGDMLNKLKLVNMFLLETLRLYGPVPALQRRTSSDLDLGGIHVPEGAILTIAITSIHRDKEVWGEDAGEFKPERFENGVTKAAKHPNALLSFSSGPRSCIGQNFAMMEAKAVVAMMLQKFSLELSPKYVHAPMDVITVRPRHVPMILKRLQV
nr:unnamed protein product [Digitaria exilis]